jgi:hypothetical protein
MFVPLTRKKEELTHMTNIFSYISQLSIGSPITHQALSLFPLQVDAGAPSGHYLLLEEALATGRFRISEVSESGAVPRLLAINETPDPVFLLDGEELTGAKQNRVLNVSIMLAPESTTEIPVSCVEAGRWRAESDSFRAPGRVHFSRGRADKMRQVSESLLMRGRAESDQSAIWDAIAAKSARMRVDSPTSAMAAMYERRGGDLQSYLEALDVRAGQVGAVYAIGSKIAGLDLFDSERTYARLARKLISSYAVDAMEEDTDLGGLEPNEANAFLKTLSVASFRRYPTAGLGENVRLEAPGLVGAALEVDGSCVHLAAFPGTQSEFGDMGRGPAWSRMQRSSLRGGRW